MTIITGFTNSRTPEWNDRIENLRKTANRQAIGVLSYACPTEDCFIVKHPDLYLSMCWKYKVIFLQEMLDSYTHDFVWIDGDCLVAKTFNMSEALDGCDVALTLRDIKDRHASAEPVRDGYINSGVIFLRNNQFSRDFLRYSKEELINSLYDQEAFNRVILKHSKMEKHGEIVTFKGLKIKLLDCREWNNFYLDESARKARILHFKGDGRKEYNRWLANLAQNG